MGGLLRKHKCDSLQDEDKAPYKSGGIQRPPLVLFAVIASGGELKQSNLMCIQLITFMIYKYAVLFIVFFSIFFAMGAPFVFQQVGCKFTHITILTFLVESRVTQCKGSVL